MYERHCTCASAQSARFGTERARSGRTAHMCLDTIDGTDKRTDHTECARCCARSRSRGLSIARASPRASRGYFQLAWTPTNRNARRSSAFQVRNEAHAVRHQAAEAHAAAHPSAILDAATAVLDAAPSRARPSSCCARTDKACPTTTQVAASSSRALISCTAAVLARRHECSPHVRPAHARSAAQSLRQHHLLQGSSALARPHATKAAEPGSISAFG